MRPDDQIIRMLAGGHFEWLMQDRDERPDLVALDEKYGHLKPEIEAAAEEMRSAFA